ncbi:phage tail tube protein [uncultured Roseobacter sp.]|uniref:phage tail tube protein n=1 Tax=uncultured Roseobacter sp. TaxID=114847 RepID=UPI002630A131|nr:phage tail tube protein [uncultured Roseobacter sp.]
MPEAPSQVDISHNDELWIGRTVASVLEWTQIYGIESLPFPDQVPDDIDITHQQSPGRTRETKPGLLPVADFTQEKQYWPAHAGDVLIEELSALTAAGTREEVLFEFHIEGAARRTYRGYVNSFTPTGEVGGKRMASMNAKIFERQPTNERVIA